jgi:glyoxylase-like metal-dependent hydrolase (beta-lactamase superfamily II)
MKKKINLKDYIDAMRFKINHLNIQIFHFNLFQVNTLVCYDETKSGVIVDPGMCNKEEQQMLLDFVTKEKIEVKYILNTHPHIDHILGNAFCVATFQVPLVAHKSGQVVYKDALEHATSFGFSITDYPKCDFFVNEGDTLHFGNQNWKVLYTPGHCDGSVCFYDDNNKFVIVGDVLFAGSIGRTDLPTGNFHQLMRNINEKLLILGDDVVVIPGHAETTTIGHEKMYNDYIH